jgi:hypothetical protein
VFDPTYPHVDMSDFKICDWKNFYGNVEEAIPTDAPESRGKEVDLRLYVDSDHAGEKLTRRSRTGYFIFMNMAPVTWFSKQQPTIETSVYGAEFVTTTEVYKSTMEEPSDNSSDDLYSHNPSEVSCLEARQIMKDGLRSVIMSKLAFDTFKEFNAAASEHDSENPLPVGISGIHKSVNALLDEELTEGEVQFTKAFCKDPEIKESAKSHSLTAHAEWTFKHTRDRTTEPLTHEVILYLFATI